MSMPPGLLERLHREKEIHEAELPYDPDMPTHVVLKQGNEQNTTVVWEKNPWDLFDRKVVISYTGNHRRIDLLKAEFARVGLYDVEIQWLCDDIYVPRFQEMVLCSSSLENNTYELNKTLCTYRAIKTSYDIGCSHCLFMYDDIRFLRDVCKLHNLVASLPKDFGIALMDSEFTSQWEAIKSGTDAWNALIPHSLSLSSLCFAINKNAMKTVLKAFEEPIINDNILRGVDSLFNPIELKDTKIYYSYPVIARRTSPTLNPTQEYIKASLHYDDFGSDRKHYGK